jgi:hypothetical protein
LLLLLHRAHLQIYKKRISRKIIFFFQRQSEQSNAVLLFRCFHPIVFFFFRILEHAAKIKTKLQEAYEKESKSIPQRDFAPLRKFQNRELDTKSILQEKTLRRNIQRIRKESEQRQQLDPSLSLPSSFSKYVLQDKMGNVYNEKTEKVTEEASVTQQKVRVAQQKYLIEEREILKMISSLSMALRFTSFYGDVDELNNMYKSTSSLYGTLPAMTEIAVTVFLGLGWETFPKDEFRDYIQEKAFLTMKEIQLLERLNQKKMLHSSRNDNETMRLSVVPTELVTKEKFMQKCLEFMETHRPELKPLSLTEKAMNKN